MLIPLEISGMQLGWSCDHPKKIQLIQESKYVALKQKVFLTWILFDIIDNAWKCPINEIENQALQHTHLCQVDAVANKMLSLLMGECERKGLVGSTQPEEGWKYFPFNVIHGVILQIFMKLKAHNFDFHSGDGYFLLRHISLIALCTAQHH